MGFLIRHDYGQLITNDDLNVIIGNNEHILDEAMKSTQVEIESYLRDRYDVALMFPDLTQWTESKTFNIDQAIILAADNWTAKNYAVGDLVSFDSGQSLIYRCVQLTVSNEIPTNVTYWEPIGIMDQLYSCIQIATNQKPNDAAYFTPTEQRDPHLVRMFIDLMLYELNSRIKPRNIPEFRIQRHDDVIMYLKNVADPRKNISPNFPLIILDDGTGFDISFGTSPNVSNHQY
jgi:phage gp36-like protein